MNLDKSLAFYKDRFADASDFTFVFVGSFDLPTMKPLVERYLGSLPSTHRKETWKDVGARTPTGVITRQVRKGSNPRARRRSSSPARFPPISGSRRTRGSHPRDGRDSADPPARHHPRGSGRDLQHYGARQRSAHPAARVFRHHLVSAAIRNGSTISSPASIWRSSSSRRRGRPTSK